MMIGISNISSLRTALLRQSQLDESLSELYLKNKEFVRWCEDQRLKPNVYNFLKYNVEKKNFNFKGIADEVSLSFPTVSNLMRRIERELTHNYSDPITGGV